MRLTDILRPRSSSSIYRRSSLDLPLQFEVLDADELWGYRNNRFDLVQTRIMNGFSLRSWPQFYQYAFDCLKPGGWVENQKFDCQIGSDDDTIPEDGKLQE